MCHQLFRGSTHAWIGSTEGRRFSCALPHSCFKGSGEAGDKDFGSSEPVAVNATLDTKSDDSTSATQESETTAGADVPTVLTASDSGNCHIPNQANLNLRTCNLSWSVHIETGLDVNVAICTFIDWNEALLSLSPITTLTAWPCPQYGSNPPMASTMRHSWRPLHAHSVDRAIGPTAETEYMETPTSIVPAATHLIRRID